MLALACAIALDPASYNVQNGAHIQSDHTLEPSTVHGNNANHA
jgi:hypothetical protein